MSDISLSQSVISIINSKYIRIRESCQHFFKQDVKPLPSQPILYIANQNPIIIKILDILARHENYYGSHSVFPKQTTLAHELGVSRQYVNELLGELVAAGIIMSNYRHKKSCEYKFSSYFNLLDVRNALSSLIPSFKWINITVLATTLLHLGTTKNFLTTQIKNPFIYIKKLLPRLSKEEELYTSNIVNLEATRHSHRKKRKFIMSNPIIPEIRHIPGVNFSIANQIALSLFPAEAIRSAFNEFKQCRNVSNPFGWFRSVCRKYCDERNIQLNYEWIFQLERAYKSNPKQFSIQDESPYTAADLKPIAKPSQPKKTISYGSLKRETAHQSPTVPKDRRFLHDSLNQEQISDKYRQSRKDWIKTLPPAPEETLCQMAKFFPGTPEQFEEIIAKNNEDRKEWLLANSHNSLYANAKKESPKINDEPDIEYGSNYNDDELYEEIIEEPIW